MLAGPDGSSNHHKGCNETRDSVTEKVPTEYAGRNESSFKFHPTDVDKMSPEYPCDAMCEGTITVVLGPHVL